MWPYVQINNKNQMQGPVTEVERHLLFVGTAPTNTGKLLSLNTQSDFDKLLGEADSELKTNLQAAMANAGQNWTAAAFVLPTDMDWKDAVREAQKTQSFEGCVVLGQEWDAAKINAAHALNQELIAKWGRWQFMLLVVAGIGVTVEGGQGWSEYEAELVALQDGIKAESVTLLPQLWPNLAGAYAGRLCNRAVSIADSPARVKTGAVVGLGNKPKDKDGVELPLATLQTLEQNRYSVPMWYPDYDGIYWADGRTLDAEGGDYQVIENLRVVYKVARRMRVRAIARIGDRSFNSTPGSTAAAILYFGKDLRTMAKAATIDGKPFPGDIASPKDGDITIQWIDKNHVSIYVKVRTVDCPKGIDINIMLDLSLNNGEG
ncbi:tail sheath protein [Aeromonas phage P05B]|nr:tail sheath protein [Aeromonas phage P05B]